jgi:hypothetical protein
MAIFAVFWNKKKYLSTIHIGFFLVTKIRKLAGEKKKKTLQVLAFSLIFLFPFFCVSHISFVQKFHTLKMNIALKIFYFCIKKKKNCEISREKKGKVLRFFWVTFPVCTVVLVW